MATAIVRLRPGRARPFWHGNPLVFSGAVASIDGNPGPGDWVELRDADDRVVGQGWHHPTSLYRVRVARLAREDGRAVLVVTHDAELARRATRRVHLVDGRIVSDER